ncbi:iron-sulfur protein [Streptomyces sp. CB09001]|uniref:Rieske (2Fe-2S) protein n=1 Tax=unclassified Streptomyces TaxID=2593676 RepID=UPI000E21706C|nr:Rieske (2Fe-2S) protein [Streptomyces sp. CB09001]AXL87858.1 iron-sulfur protein [Streptomyces sp. CB09001]
MTQTPTRRTVLLSTGAGAAALCVGCGGGGGDSSGASPGQELVRTGDVPVAGGKILTAEKIVVTQPEQGEFKAFSAVCTHQGCIVSDVRDGTIDCACHGSRFAVADGSVVRGPATEPLPGKRITVEGNSVRLA